jgi:hypothetical protein
MVVDPDGAQNQECRPAENYYGRFYRKQPHAERTSIAHVQLLGILMSLRGLRSLDICKKTRDISKPCRF